MPGSVRRLPSTSIDAALSFIPFDPAIDRRSVIAMLHGFYSVVPDMQEHELSQKFVNDAADRRSRRHAKIELETLATAAKTIETLLGDLSDSATSYLTDQCSASGLAAFQKAGIVHETAIAAAKFDEFSRLTHSIGQLSEIAQVAARVAPDKPIGAEAKGRPTKDTPLIAAAFLAAIWKFATKKKPGLTNVPTTPATAGGYAGGTTGNFLKFCEVMFKTALPNEINKPAHMARKALENDRFEDILTQEALGHLEYLGR